MDDIITPTERAYFRTRYKLGGNGPDAAIAYTIKTALAYANAHAAGAPPFVKSAIARLFVHFMLQPDKGEKQLLMLAIDNLIAMGAATHARIH